MQNMGAGGGGGGGREALITNQVWELEFSGASRRHSSFSYKCTRKLDRSNPSVLGEETESGASTSGKSFSPAVFKIRTKPNLPAFQQLGCPQEAWRGTPGELGPFI